MKHSLCLFMLKYMLLQDRCSWFFINMVCYGRNIWATASVTKVGPWHSMCQYYIAGWGSQWIPGEFLGKCHLCSYHVSLMMTSELLPWSRVLLLTYNITYLCLNVTKLTILNMWSQRNFFAVGIEVTPILDFKKLLIKRSLFLVLWKIYGDTYLQTRAYFYSSLRVWRIWILFLNTMGLAYGSFIKFREDINCTMLKIIIWCIIN